jgi:hypothetical protein
MNSNRRSARLAIIVLVVTSSFMLAIPHTTRAHGGGPGLNYDPCARYAGLDNFVHFSAYQPQFNRFAEYCGSLPRSGKTLLVFDLIGAEMVNAPIALEIVREGGAQQFSLPARRYPTGVIHVETELKAGRYETFLTIGEAPRVYRVNFDLAVGSWWSPLIPELVVGSIVLLVAIGYCAYQARLLAGETPRAASPGLPSAKSA